MDHLELSKGQANSPAPHQLMTCLFPLVQILQYIDYNAACL